MSKLVLRIAYVIPRTIFIHESRRCELCNVANCYQSVHKPSYVPHVGFSCPRDPQLAREEHEGVDSRQSRGTLLVARDFISPRRGRGELNEVTKLFLSFPSASAAQAPATPQHGGHSRSGWWCTAIVSVPSRSRTGEASLGPEQCWSQECRFRVAGGCACTEHRTAGAGVLCVT